jgi:hypothetical protein
VPHDCPILGKTGQENAIDADLSRTFICEKVYLGYARKNLLPTQIDGWMASISEVSQ